MKNEKGNVVAGLLVLLVGLLAIYGWIANIVKLIAFAVSTEGFAAIGLMEILRIVGIFAAPLGSILGFF